MPHSGAKSKTVEGAIAFGSLVLVTAAAAGGLGSPFFFSMILTNF